MCACPVGSVVISFTNFRLAEENFLRYIVCYCVSNVLQEFVRKSDGHEFKHP